MTASTPNPRRWCEIDGPHPSHPSEWGGDICPGAVPEDLDIVPIEPHPWSAPPAPSSGSPAPTCGDCDGTGWYDGDNRCPNGCPIPASSGSPAPILDAPITWDASADTGPIAWCVAHGSKAALCAAAGRACRAASTFSAPAPLSPVPEDGPDFDLPRALRGWAKHVRLDEFRTAAEVMELAAVHIEHAEQQEQAVLACINIYGDEVLHSALDAIGYLTRPAAADRGGEQP